MPTISITPQKARRFLLRYHGLLPPRRLRGTEGILELIDRLGCIQFDPIDIVGRNASLVLQSRVAEFDDRLLDELLYQERRLMDGWDKNMSIFKTEDWPCFSRRRQAYTDHYAAERFARVRAAAPVILREIQERGPLSSQDVNLDETVDWSWAPTRLARAVLESLFLSGTLTIHHKTGTRKHYDLTERILPDEITRAADPHPDDATYDDWYVARRIDGIGMIWDRAGDAWLGMQGIKTARRRAAMRRLEERGVILRVEVDSITTPFFTSSMNSDLLERVRYGDPLEKHEAAIIAPLDNILWDRKMTESLFDFSYRWEVYKPAAERIYGYYVLPILYGDRFVARFEPGKTNPRKGKSYRSKTNTQEHTRLIIKNWWWESDVVVDDEMRCALKECFRAFLAYLGVPRLQISPDAAGRSSISFLEEIDNETGRIATLQPNAATQLGSQGMNQRESQ